MITRSGTLLLAALALSGCFDRRAAVARMTPKDVDRFARDYLVLVKSGAFDSATVLLQPSLIDSGTRHALGTVQASLKGALLDSAHVVGAHWTSVALASGASYRNTTLVYEMPAAKGWILAEFVVADSGDRRRVASLHVNPIAQSLEETTAFSFSGKPLLNYLWFAAGIANLILSLTGVVLLIRARGMPKKKRWILASLIGVGKFSFNWTTGATSFAPLSIQLFGFALVGEGLTSPMILGVSLPIGAAFAIAHWYQWRHPKLDDTDVPPAPAA